MGGVNISLNIDDISQVLIQKYRILKYRKYDFVILYYIFVNVSLLKINFIFRRYAYVETSAVLIGSTFH